VDLRVATFAALTIPLPVALTNPAVVRTWLSPWRRLTTVMVLTISIGLAGSWAWSRGYVGRQEALLFWAPMYQVILGYSLHFVLQNVAGRKLVDTVSNWTSGLFIDRVYAMAVALGGIVVPWLIVGHVAKP